MFILTLRTDNPQAEVSLWHPASLIENITWQAHRQLAETIHIKIKDLLLSQNKQLKDLAGIVVYQGPGSFTGLRIGISVGNALARSLDIPISGATGADWVQQGIRKLQHQDKGQPVIPEYGASPHITKPKH
jgi:tRNA threonylcarbamoyladenosine biosynthesis protein TsaB